MREDRADLLVDLIENCNRVLRALDGVDDDPEIWALRADIVELAHEAEDTLLKLGASLDATGRQRVHATSR